MAKTKPIGVRFRPEILNFIKEKVGADSPQKAVVFMENFYRQHYDKVSILDALRDAPPKEDSPEDEYKAKYEALTAVLKEIRSVKAEVIPTARNTAIGAKVWQQEQANKLNSLYTKLLAL